MSKTGPTSNSAGTIRQGQLSLSFKQLEATAQSLIQKCDALPKQFEDVIARLESPICHIQSKQDQIVSTQDQLFLTQDKIQSILCGGSPPFRSPSIVSWSPRTTPMSLYGVYKPPNFGNPVHNSYYVESVPSLISTDPEIESLLEDFATTSHTAQGADTTSHFSLPTVERPHVPRMMDNPHLSSSANKDSCEMSELLDGQQPLLLDGSYPQCPPAPPQSDIVLGNPQLSSVGNLDFL